jgi:hypothetical protein
VAAVIAEVHKIKPAQSAKQVQAEHIGANNCKFEVSLFSKLMHGDKWNALDAEGCKPHED